MANTKWSETPIIDSTSQSTRVCVLDGSPLRNKTISINNLIQTNISNGVQKTTTSLSAPEDPKLGDEWISLNTGIKYTWDNYEFVEL